MWFQFVNENSLCTFSGIVHSMSKEQVRGNFDRHASSGYLQEVKNNEKGSLL